jgi:hypothetical protein
MGNPPKSAQQILQDTIQSTYANKIKEQADTLPHEVLGQMLNAWAANGGGNSTQGSMATDSQGNMGQIMSPQIAANSAQSISPGQQDNNGMFGGGSGDPNSGSIDGQPAVGPDKMALLSTLTGMANPPQDNTNSDSSSSVTTGLTTPGDPIQEAALKIATQKPGMLMSIFRGIFDGNNEAQLKNLKSAQEITQGGTPMSPTERASAIGNYNTALINQHNDYQKSITDQITSTATAIDQLVKNTPSLNKGYISGAPYYKTLAGLQERLQGLTNKGKDAAGNFEKLQLTNPVPKPSSGGGIQTFNVGGVTYNIPKNQVAKFKAKAGIQ